MIATPTYFGEVMIELGISTRSTDHTEWVMVLALCLERDQHFKLGNGKWNNCVVRAWDEVKGNSWAYRAGCKWRARHGY